MPLTYTSTRGLSGDGGGVVAERDDLVRRVEAVAGLALQAEVGAGIVLDDHRELHAAVHVVLDRLDDGDALGQHHVEDVGPGPRREARTREPRRTSVPSTTTMSGPGRSSSSHGGRCPLMAAA